MLNTTYYVTTCYVGVMFVEHNNITSRRNAYYSLLTNNIS
jgi:hypothetical protein